MGKEHKNSDLEKIDMQVVSVEACNIEEVKNSFASLAEREDLQLDPDLMYARFIMAHEGANANGDFFTNEVLVRAQHTPRFKPIDWEHGQPMIGSILDSRYSEDSEGRGYIEAIGVIWKFIYPELAEQVKEQSVTGGLKLSMECYFKEANYKYGEQIFDQDQAEELSIVEYVGREYMGHKVFRVFKDVIFGGVGVVANPADKEAVFLAVAKKQAEEVIETNEVISALSDEQIKSIADIINRKTNDFRDKEISKDTTDAVTIAKYVKAFDKAKSNIVARFNKDNIATKEQLATEVRDIVDSLLADVSDISNNYIIGLANNDSNLEGGESEIAVADLNLKLCDQCNDIEVAEEKEGGSETMTAENTNNEEVVEDVVQEEVTEQKTEDVVDTDTTDYKSIASDLEATVSKLESELQGKVDAYDTLSKDFKELKEKVEAKEKEELSKSRMSELKESGIEFSEARQDKEAEKISSMDDEAFADYKDFLSELVTPKAEEKTEEVVAEDKEVEEEVEVEIENTDKSTADLNIETEQPKVIKPFGHLSE